MRVLVISDVPEGPEDPETLRAGLAMTGLLSLTRQPAAGPGSLGCHADPFYRHTHWAQVAWVSETGHHTKEQPS